MSYNSLQPLGDNYIAVTFWALATLHGQSFYPEIIESFAQTVSDVLNGVIRTPIETDHDFQRAFSGPFDTLPCDSHEDTLTVEVHRWWRIPCSLNEVDPFLT